MICSSLWYTGRRVLWKWNCFCWQKNWCSRNFL